MRKHWKRIAAAGLSAALLLSTGTALAAEPEQPKAIQVNGEIITLTDASPRREGETLYLPFRAVMEALGAEVGWEKGVVTAELRDTVVTMIPGSNQVTVKENGRTDTATLDVPVFIDPASWRTYVPVSFVEEAMDCPAGYDEAAKTVIIADPDELIAQAMEGKEFNYLNAYLGYDEQYNDGIWDVDMTAGGFFTVKGFKVPLSGTLSGTIADSSRFQIQVEMRMDLRDHPEAAPELWPLELNAEQLEALAVTGMKNELRTDLNTGNSYIQANGALAELRGESGVWFRMDNGYLGARMGVNTQEIVNSLAPLSWETAEEIADMVFDRADFNHVQTWPMVLNRVRQLYSNFCDDAFVQDGNTWTAECRPPAETGINLGRRSVTIEDGKVTGYAAYMDYSYLSPVSGETVRLVVDKTVTNGTEINRYMVEQDGVVTNELTRTLTYTPGTTEPLTLPDEGAQVRELSEMLDGAQ